MSDKSLQAFDASDQIKLFNVLGSAADPTHDEWCKDFEFDLRSRESKTKSWGGKRIRTKGRDFAHVRKADKTENLVLPSVREIQELVNPTDTSRSLDEHRDFVDDFAYSYVNGYDFNTGDELSEAARQTMEGSLKKYKGDQPWSRSRDGSHNRKGLKELLAFFMAATREPD